MENKGKTRKKKDYALSKIYKIVCNTTGLVYIGSTAQYYLSDRISNHRTAYRYYLKNDKKAKYYCTSFKILENNNYNIILIQNYPCNSKEELNREERKYIESIECVNKNIPERSINEKKEYYNNWIINHQDKFKKTQKKYYEKIKDKLVLKRKEKIKCECGSIINKCNLSIHKKSKKCLDYNKLLKN